MGDIIRYPNMGTVKKAAEIYGLSPVYIRRLCKEGKIRYVNAGHMWLVNLDSLARPRHPAAVGVVMDGTKAKCETASPLDVRRS